MIKDIRKTTPQSIAAVLQRDKLVIMPTDTVYGIIGLPEKQVLTKICKIKGRSFSKPLILFYDSISHIIKDFPDALNFQELFNKYFPGAVTFLIKNNEKYNWVSQTQKIGVRIPDYPIIREVINIIGKPLLSTSANLAGAGNIGSKQDLQEVFEGKISTIYYTNVANSAASGVVDITSTPYKTIRKGGIEIGEGD